MGLRIAGAPPLPPVTPVRGRCSSMPILTEDVDNIQNYFNYEFSASGLSEYEQIPDTKFIIEKGDEIRISYQSPLIAVEDDIVANISSSELITQDFTVIDYELAPISVATEYLSIPVGDPFRLKIPSLITSSAPQYKGMPTQINEYYKRMNIAMDNGVCFYLMGAGANNATLDGCCSGSFISTVAYSDYVVNNEGKNNPTVITVSCSIDRREPATADNGGTYGWSLGTNCSGTSKWKSTGKLDTQVSPYLTDAIGTNSPIYGPFNVALDAGFVYNRLIVNPNPRTLAKPIPSGSILSATVRKRIEDDSKVIIDLLQPSGSRGISTISGDGYLIPNDLTNIQQRNVQKIINKLQSENVFIDNSDNTTLS